MKGSISYGSLSQKRLVFGRQSNSSAASCVCAGTSSSWRQSATGLTHVPGTVNWSRALSGEQTCLLHCHWWLHLGQKIGNQKMSGLCRQAIASISQKNWSSCEFGVLAVSITFFVGTSWYIIIWTWKSLTAEVSGLLLHPWHSTQITHIITHIKRALILFRKVAPFSNVWKVAPALHSLADCWDKSTYDVKGWTEADPNPNGFKWPHSFHWCQQSGHLSISTNMDSNAAAAAADDDDDLDSNIHSWG